MVPSIPCVSMKRASKEAYPILSKPVTQEVPNPSSSTRSRPARLRRRRRRRRRAAFDDIDIPSPTYTPYNCHEIIGSMIFVADGAFGEAPYTTLFSDRDWTTCQQWSDSINSSPISQTRIYLSLSSRPSVEQSSFAFSPGRLNKIPEPMTCFFLIVYPTYQDFHQQGIKTINGPSLMKVACLSANKGPTSNSKLAKGFQRSHQRRLIPHMVLPTKGTDVPGRKYRRPFIGLLRSRDSSHHRSHRGRLRYDLRPEDYEDGHATFVPLAQSHILLQPSVTMNLVSETQSDPEIQIQLSILRQKDQLIPKAKNPLNLTVEKFIRSHIFQPTCDSTSENVVYLFDVKSYPDGLVHKGLVFVRSNVRGWNQRQRKRSAKFACSDEILLDVALSNNLHLLVFPGRWQRQESLSPLSESYDNEFPALSRLQERPSEPTVGRHRSRFTFAKVAAGHGTVSVTAVPQNFQTDSKR